MKLKLNFLSNNVKILKNMTRLTKINLITKHILFFQKKMRSLEKNPISITYDPIF